MTSEKWAQKFRTDDVLLPRYEWWFSSEEADFQPIRRTTQILNSDTSSVSNFYARFSDVISWGNQWWRREMSAVFSTTGKQNF